MKVDSYIRNHALVYRCYDMLTYFKAFRKYKSTKKEIQKSIYNNLHNIETVETYAKYFNLKMKKNKRKIELRFNLKDLISDLNFLKQLLEKENLESHFLEDMKKEEEK